MNHDRFIPESLSIADPSFRNFAGRVTVTLDGEDVTNRCIGFDRAKGETILRRRDESGELFVDPGTDEIARETRTGKVEVKWK